MVARVRHTVCPQPRTTSVRPSLVLPGRGRATAGRYACSSLWARGLDVDRDRSPLALLEPHDAQRRARRMADDDRRPDVGPVEAVHRLEQRAESERDDHLRDDRDEKWAARVAGALETAGVAERDGDEETRHTQVEQQQPSYRQDHRVGHSEDRQQVARNEHEHRTDDDRDAETDLRRDRYPLYLELR